MNRAFIIHCAGEFLLWTGAGFLGMRLGWRRHERKVNQVLDKHSRIAADSLMKAVEDGVDLIRDKYAKELLALKQAIAAKDQEIVALNAKIKDMACRLCRSEADPCAYPDEITKLLRADNDRLNMYIALLEDEAPAQLLQSAQAKMKS